MKSSLFVRSFLPIIILACLSGCGNQYSTATKPTTLQRTAVANPDELIAPREASHNLESLNLEQLERVKNYYIAIDSKDLAVKAIEQMIKKATDQGLLKSLRLELADLYFELGKMEESSKMYTTYLALYPGSEYRAYVHYQAILCRFYMSLSTDRDQSRTQEALRLALEYMRKARIEEGSYTAYAEDVTQIKHECSQKLFDSDLNIFNFYLKKGSYKACKVHLKNMKDRFIDLLDTAEYDLLALECTVAEKLGDSEMLAEAQNILRKKYPNKTSIMVAHNEQHKAFDPVTLF